MCLELLILVILTAFHRKLEHTDPGFEYVGKRDNDGRPLVSSSITCSVHAYTLYITDNSRCCWTGKRVWATILVLF